MIKYAHQKVILRWLRSSAWSFPLLLLLVLLVLTAFKIHGSSIGVYHTTLYSNETKDPSLIYGKPKPIRSDEWRIWTPLATLQSKTNFPTFNTNLGSGRDVSIQPDTPTKDWATIFRPHNWSFFALPLEYAYAFRWWFVLFMLIVTAYFFALRLLNGSKKLAILLSISFALSPFLLWWYQTSAFLPMAYALLGIIIGIRIIDKEKIPFINSHIVTKILYVSALSYLGTSFALLIYAPFMIPVAIVSAAFLIGYILQKKSSKHELLRIILLFGAATFTMICILAGFFMQHSQAISAIANSAYPGQRVIESGGQNALAIFDGFLMPLLQSGSRALNYAGNQSEASNFILLLPFLLIPGFLVIFYMYYKTKKINWPLLLIQLVSALFILRLLVPFGDPLYKLLLLDKVPHNRLLIGLGFVGFIQLILFIRSYGELKLKPRNIITPLVIYSLVCLTVLLLMGVYVINTYPAFLSEPLLMAGFAIFFTAIITTFLLKKNTVGAILLLLFTLGSSFSILPIYRGLDFFKNSAIVTTMESISKPGDSWIVLDSLNYEALPLAAGRATVGGPQIYSDLRFWQQIDNNRRYENVYNRQGHALFLSNTLKPNPSAKNNVETISEDLELVKSNMFKIKFTCSDFTYKNIDFTLSTHRVDFPCLKLIEQVSYPKKTFFIYQVMTERH